MTCWRSAYYRFIQGLPSRKVCDGGFHRMRSLPKFNFYASAGAEYQAIVNWLGQVRPQVILGQTGHTSLKLLPIARESGIPIVAHFHGADLSSGLRNRWYRWSLMHELSGFDAVIVVGSHQRQWMIQHKVPAEKIHLIPCGVPTQLFTPVPRPPSGRVVFLAVSRLVEKKGVEYTLRAFARLRSQCHDVELVIVGDGPLRDRLEKLARDLRVASQVSFRGACTPDEVRALLSQSDIFVQHSVVPPDGAMEGSPVAIAEASAAGLPVVVTRGCGGTEDLVIHGRTGFLVEQRDTDDMAACMVRLAQDAGLRAQLGRAGRTHMCKEFDAERQIAKLEDVLLQVATPAGK